jgi:HD superfamily phosphohydrolase
MYSSVYLHKKTRIADMMFLKAARMSILEHGEFVDFWFMTDDELLSMMIKDSEVEYVRDIAWRLKYRQDLFKRVFHVEAGSIGPRERRILQNISKLSDHPKDVSQLLETMISDPADIPDGYVIVDLVSAAAEISEQRFKELDILFLDEKGRAMKLEDIDRPFYDYIHNAQPSRSVLSIYIPDSYREKGLSVLPGIFQSFDES